jgi:glutamate--cysteine ligase catalytic subunit
VNTEKFFFRKKVFPAGTEGQYILSQPVTPPQLSRSITPSDDCGCGCGGELKKTEPAHVNGVNGVYEAVHKKETMLKNCFPELEGNALPPSDIEVERTVKGPVEEEYTEMSIKDIFCGNVSSQSGWWRAFSLDTQDNFPGLIGLVNAYLNSLDVDFDDKRRLRKYIDLIRRRADGMSPLATREGWV